MNDASRDLPHGPVTGRVPQNYVKKIDILWGLHLIYIFVFLNSLRIFVPHAEILFFINQYVLVCIFKYRTSLREFH